MALMEYRVSVPFRGVDIGQDNAIVNIPIGTILRKINRQALSTFITVWWDTRELLVFERDLSERAVEGAVERISYAKTI